MSPEEKVWNYKHHRQKSKQKGLKVSYNSSWKCGKHTNLKKHPNIFKQFWTFSIYFFTNGKISPLLKWSIEFPPFLVIFLRKESILKLFCQESSSSSSSNFSHPSHSYSLCRKNTPSSVVFVKKIPWWQSHFAIPNNLSKNGDKGQGKLTDKLNLWLSLIRRCHNVVPRIQHYNYHARKKPLKQCSAKLRTL